MISLLNQLMNEEAGFIISAELVLVASIAVLAMIVGLSEVSLNVSEELEDVGSAFGSISQNYHINGICGHQASIFGSCFRDMIDFCDNNNDICPNVNYNGEGSTN